VIRGSTIAQHEVKTSQVNYDRGASFSNPINAFTKNINATVEKYAIDVRE
jgi:hypothetical protein